MEHLIEYGIFFAKFMTVILVLVIVAGGIFIMIFRSRTGMDGHLNITNLNSKFETMGLMLNSQILPKKEFKKTVKEHKALLKKKDKGTDLDKKRKRVFVIDFKGDIRATEVTSLREEITAILTVATTGDEVLVKLESAGGTVHGYGLAASQLKRIRDKGIHLTIAVDKVAASGGYMMACVAHKIIAAPFAIIGSVGVLAQMPNFNRLLKKHDIDFEEITAGKYKRTLTLFGENTDEDREKMREELADIHLLFKEFIHENRSQVDVEKIATGEHWHGKRALELKLVDELRTSDDYLSSSVNTADIFEIDYERKKSMSEKIISFGIKLLDHFS
ncbi:MAG: protease SohB [Gammaproteobacteria bacterium RIFCSPLOWO2_12_FULL_47_76]|nr:MAG: protease SohB [Gammaproteobacteria bacterium RIFCSPLOWO2_12_FULL_47_76]